MLIYLGGYDNPRSLRVNDRLGVQQSSSRGYLGGIGLFRYFSQRTYSNDHANDPNNSQDGSREILRRQQIEVRVRFIFVPFGIGGGALRLGMHLGGLILGLAAWGKASGYGEHNRGDSGWLHSNETVSN